MQANAASEKRPRPAIYCRINETDDAFDKVAMQEKILREFSEKQGYATSDSRVHLDSGISAFLETRSGRLQPYSSLSEAHPTHQLRIHSACVQYADSNPGAAVKLEEHSKFGPCRSL